MFEVAVIMNFGCKCFNIHDCPGDFVANLGHRREVWVAEPIMADHALLVGVGNRAFLERVHCGESLLHARLDEFEEAFRKLDAAQVQSEAELRIIEIPFLEMVPGNSFKRLHNPTEKVTEWRVKTIARRAMSE